MSDAIELVVLVAFGFAGGVAGGLLGIGGAALFVPALLLVGLTQVEAQATALVSMVPASVVGAWSQHRYGNLRLRDGLVIGALSPAGVLLGVVIANGLPERALELGFAGLQLYVAYRLVRRALG